MSIARFDTQDRRKNHEDRTGSRTGQRHCAFAPRSVVMEMV
jgi:hypothetical protein